MFHKLILDNAIMPALWNLIMSADKNIKISNFKMELGSKSKYKKIEMLFSAIKLKIKEGIPIKILLDQSQPGRSVSRYNVPAALRLKEAGADVRFLPGGRCVHAKTVIIDDEYYYIGSHNFSTNAFSRNFEVGTIIQDCECGGELARFFDVLFETAIAF